MKRTVAAMLSATLLLLVLALPAAAHTITVTPSGTGEAKHGWVGSLALPGNGQGLIPGGPGGAWMISPSHAKGLNTACYRLQDNPSVVDIRGPGGPGCPHGS